MYIPIFKDEDIIIQVKEISEKVVATLVKQKKDNCLPAVKKNLNALNAQVFSFEFSDIAGYKKVFGLNGSKRLIVYCIDEKNIIYYSNTIPCFNFKLYDEKDDFYSNAHVAESIFRSQLSDKLVKSSVTAISPYLMNQQVTDFIKKHFVDIRYDISMSMNKIDSFLFFKYSNVYKKESLYFIKYFKNKLFNYVDRNLFKELYSYYLHFSGTNIYNLLKTAPDKVYQNFQKFKKEHNFLSMFFADQPKTVLYLYLNSYDTIISNIALSLKVKESEMEPLKGCSYNDFLYIKTPQKYFKILNKFNLSIDKKLSLQQVKFLNELVYRNNTFVKPQDISKILNNEALLQRFMKIFQIRKALKLSHDDKNYYKDVDSYINETITKFNETLEEAKEKFTKFKKLNKSYVLAESDRKKTQLIPVEKNIMLDSIKSYVMEGVKSYSNLQYWEELISSFSTASYANENHYTFILKENRQEHLIILIITDKNIIFNDKSVTPRVAKLLKEMLKDSSFIDYVFNNIIYDKKYVTI